MYITDHLIIGSGIAGLSAAQVFIKQKESVGIISKSNIYEGNTSYAQGGIAVAFQDDDTPIYHFEDTLQAGAGLCDEKAVKILVEEGPERVKELINLGADFDKQGAKFDLTKEAAHSKRRILHAKDATGKEIEKTLGKGLKESAYCQFFPNTCVIKLIQDQDTCVGCWAFHEEKPTLFMARKSVLIATGGCGQIFQFTTNPAVATGDGIALAHHLGCRIMDMEFIQFHPTTLYTGDKKPISIFLITEAIRGEGALLRNHLGKRFMPDYHADAELAPRDIVARSIFFEMQKTQHPVFLDVTPLKSHLKTRFPTVYERALKASINPLTEMIPVAPSAHYCMGGIETSVFGQTKIKRLYAAGEVACLRIHGANRLASNSLLEGLVFGHRAAHHALNLEPRIPRPEKMPDLKGVLIDEKQLRMLQEDIKKILWNHAGIVRSLTGLNQAKQQLETLSQTLPQRFPLSSLESETVSLLKVGQLVVQAALERKESLGAHFIQQ